MFISGNGDKYILPKNKKEIPVSAKNKGIENLRFTF